MSQETNMLEIDEVFRDAGSPVYLIGKPELTIVIGMPAWRRALDRLGMSPQANRDALAGKTPATYGSRKEMGRWRPIRSTLPGDKAVCVAVA